MFPSTRASLPKATLAWELMSPCTMPSTLRFPAAVMVPVMVVLLPITLLELLISSAALFWSLLVNIFIIVLSKIYKIFRVERFPVIPQLKVQMRAVREFARIPHNGDNVSGADKITHFFG